MPGFRSDGISGYVGKRVMKRPFGKRRGFKRRRKFAKRIVRIVRNENLVKNVYSVVLPRQSFVAVNTVGTQDLQTIAVKLSGADVINIFAQIKARAQTGLTNTSNRISSININAYILQIAMKNAHQFNGTVDLYEVIPRTDNTTDIVQEWKNLVSQQPGAQAAGGDCTIWGWTPFQCPLIGENYKILRKVRYMLAPGSQEIVEIRDLRKTRVDLSRYYALSGADPAGNQAIRGLTKYWVAITKGEPINDSVNKTNVNTSSYKVDFAAREDYHYTWDINDYNPAVNSTNSLAAIANNESGILIDTGAAIAPPVEP